MFEPKKILVPIDFSDYSENSLKEAVDIAKRNGSRIYILHVVDEIIQCAVDYCLDSALVEETQKQSMKFAEEKMKKLVDEIGLPKDIVEFDIKKGDAAKTILEEQVNKGIDLIVIAPHGRKGFIERLGSVSDKILRGAKCEVLLVR